MTRIALMLFWILIGAGAFAPAAEAQVQVNARLTTGVVKLGSPVSLMVEVVGANDVRVSPPVVEGLRFGKPAVVVDQMNTVISGGRRMASRALTYSIPVQPEHKGDFKITSMEVVADGKTLTSNELWLKVVEDLQGEQLGRFEISAPSTVVEGQPFTIELRFGWDARLDRQVNHANLSLPWYGELGGVVELDPPAQEPGVSTLSGVAINNSGSNVAEQLPNEKTDSGEFRMLRIRRRFLASRPGKLDFPISHFEFGQVPEGNFLLRGETKLYYKRFPAFSIDVIALPEAGRPIEFSGAVGTLRATARTDRSDVNVGDSIKLSVEWTGEGNLEFFEPPELDRLDAFQGFRYFGKDSGHKTAVRRVLTYDIAPKSEKLTEIPAIPLCVFDPKQNAYVTIATQPLPIRVRKLANTTGLTEESHAQTGQYDIRDIQTTALVLRTPSSPGSTVLWGGITLVGLGWMGARTYVRRHGDPASPALRARRRARKQLEKALRNAPQASAQALALRDFLAARTGERSEAWIGRDVLGWHAAHDMAPISGTAARTDDAARSGNVARSGNLAHSGTEARPGLEEARELARLFDELDERIWAGRDEALPNARVLEVADRMLKGGL